MSVTKLSSNWSYIKQRAFDAGCALIKNHNDVEEKWFKNLITGFSSVMLRKRIEKATDQEVFEKYMKDYNILKVFFQELEEFEGLEDVEKNFGLPNLTKMKTLNNNVFED